MKRFEIFFGIIKIPVDFLMTILAFLAAYRLRLYFEQIGKPIDFSVLPTINEYILFSSYAAIALVFVFAFGKLYSLRSTSGFAKEIRQTLTHCAIWAMFIISYFFFTRTFPFSRLVMLYSWSLTFLFIIIGRGLIHLFQLLSLKNGIGKRRLLFIGNNAISGEIYEKLRLNPSYKILGAIGNKNEATKLKFLGTISQLTYLFKKRKPDEIIQTQSDLPGIKDDQIIEFCELKHIQYRFVPDLLEVKRSNVETQTIGGIPIISLKPTPLDGWGKVVKRGFDLIGASFGLIILSPIFLITAIAIKLDSKGPIFFWQLDDGNPVKRVGQRGKLFTFYKFRSMHPNTHNLRYTKLAAKNTRKNSPLFKISNDPRVTKVGHFIRKYSIDELPQLWNVIKGDISLVGPRPNLPEEVANYKNHHHFKYTIKPGLTGLAQISGRSDLDFEEEIKLDRYYIENWSLWHDIKIIFKTIGVVLKGHQE